MSLFPSLPVGFVAQPVSHRDLAGLCYELNFVYNPAGRLDRDRTFWIITRLDMGAPPLAWVQTYADHRRAWGKRAVPFRQFRAYDAAPSSVETWLHPPPEPYGSSISTRHPEPVRV